MARKRIDSGDEVELGVATSFTNRNHSNNHTSSDDNKLAKSSSKSLKERFQSIGLVAMIICFIVIGFQMTTNDAYSKKIDHIMSVDTPSPTQHDIEVVVHEDDGDVEVDVPQQLPPDISPKNQHYDGTSLAFRRIATNNNESSSATNANLITPIRREPLKLQQLHSKLSMTSNNKANNANGKQGNREQKPQQRQKQKPLINIRSKKEPYTDKGASHLEKLPTIEEMKANDTRRFYSNIEESAKIYGWDLQCSTMDKCDGKQKEFTIISGLYNTGTNVAYKLIAQNCMTKMRFQPAWGKHEMPTPEKVEWWNTHPMDNNPVGLYSDKSVLVVVVKDPLTWIKSMCKANYDFRYTNRTWFFSSCPKDIKNSKFNWLPLNRAKIMNRNKTSNGIFDSPMHLWNEWYSQITNHIDGKKYPFLIVRFEDLLFRPENVISQFCKCLGQCKYRRGKDDNNIQIADEASKPHGHPRNRTMSFWSYSNPQYRYDGYTKQDLEFMLDAANITLLQQFGYEFDVEKTKRMRL